MRPPGKLGDGFVQECDRNRVPNQIWHPDHELHSVQFPYTRNTNYNIKFIKMLNLDLRVFKKLIQFYSPSKLQNTLNLII